MSIETATQYVERSLVAVSTKAIKFHIDEADKVVYSTSPSSLLPAVHGVLQVIPEQGTCAQCGHEMAAVPTDQVPLFHQADVLPVQVHKKVCSSCRRETCFDGGEVSILNMGSFLMHHSLLRDYMLHFLFSGTSIHNYFRVWKQRMQDIGSNTTQLTYYKFRMGWYAFLGLLDLEGGVCLPHLPGKPRSYCDGWHHPGLPPEVPAGPTSSTTSSTNGSRKISIYSFITLLYRYTFSFLLNSGC
ncbi:uncharacterized protein LOC134445364 [Engraulis encrasicolus]|uniref:uncharacterized protein LOC134445364 n=1 Tax=Engraulis encrasicolus TaxID=184585 RepID=UPI002FD1246C